ncbi:hypothetical protein JR316_0012763 [Psilocybe cubensis]|uniref:CHAT domain-containing protein n=2 Tax=Psilocybe cubensis TaxID=181762 RepID=A0A8H7XTH4_PSICU|nr:hypothetical protein JR316_0012763 [Psilocybe cubensis]KAH9474305.1 hypothetical protein JR316_0012763 [Psilocybe cubensis]
MQDDSSEQGNIIFHHNTPGDANIVPVDALDHAAYLDRISTAFLTRYKNSGKSEILDEAIAAQRKALSIYVAHPPTNPECLNNLANMLLIRFDRMKQMKDVHDAITYHLESLSLRPPGDHSRSIALLGVGQALKCRYERRGSVWDLEGAILAYKELQTICTTGHPNRQGALNGLASCLIIRYEQRGNIVDLEQCISSVRESLKICPGNHPEHSRCFDSLAAMIMARYNRFGEIKDLDEAMGLHQKALDFCPAGHPLRSLTLVNFSISRRKRYERIGNIDDIAQAISYTRETLKLHPFPTPLRATSLNTIANSLLTRYNALGSINDLEEAIAYFHEAINIYPSGHHERAKPLNNIANAIHIRYELFGETEDLEKLLTYRQEALSLYNEKHIERAGALNHLASAFHLRFIHLGLMEDLEECISLHRVSMELSPSGDGRYSSLCNFINALQTRYERLGTVEDLDEAISFLNDGLRLESRGNMQLSVLLNNFGSIFQNRYKLLNRVDDLDNSITLHREALEMQSLGHPLRYMSLTNLASALQARYIRLNALEDLEQAIQLLCESLENIPAGHLQYSLSIHNLADVLSNHPEEQNVNEAVELGRQALRLLPTGHSGFSSFLKTLGDVLNSRFQKFGNIDDREEAFRMYEQAAGHAMSPSLNRLIAAVRWMYLANRYTHQSVMRACKLSLELLHRSSMFQGNLESQHRFLATSKFKIPSTLASDAASFAIMAGNLKLAVEFLEQGRAILWAKVNNYKTSLEELQQISGGAELADRLELLNSQLNGIVFESHGGMIGKQGINSWNVFDTQMKRHRVLSEKWEETVEQIRNLPRFENFLQALPFKRLQLAAAEGPVIVLNMGIFCCDAIIMIKDSLPILVPLPSLDKLRELLIQVNQYRFSRQIVTVLRRLWDLIVCPVVEQLNKLRVPYKSRIWWCPTDMLCALPIHAAGPYRPGQKNLPDIYLSSYTSTLSSLIRARENVVQSLQVPKLLVVGQPGPDLQSIQDEVDAIKMHGYQASILMGQEATPDIVLSALKEHSWAHLACHGNLGEYNQLFRTHFELSGGKLTLLDLIRAKLPNAELAFLSACHSAAGGILTPDESIHLSAALQFCGFRSVVGTLWEMEDGDGPTIARAFYEYMYRNGEKADFRDSAEALYSAIRTMRKNKIPPERWIMFVHTGA